MIPKNEAQQRREAQRKADCEARLQEKLEAEERRAEVMVYTGEPFAPAGDVDAVPVAVFAKPKRRSGPRLKLSAKQRRELHHEGHPRIALPKRSPKGRKTFPCPVQAGDVVELSSQVALGVTGITETAEVYELHYRLLDARARLLRRDVHPKDFAAMRRANAKGERVDEEVSAEESAYTSSTHAAMTDEGEAVPRRYQRLLTEEADMKNAHQGEMQRRRAEVMEAEQEVADQRRRGKPTSLAEAAAERASRRAQQAA